jgi:hypothetical protein
MGAPLHRRWPLAVIEAILEAFSQHELSAVHACERLGLKRARLYCVEQQDLQARPQGGR